LKCSLSIGKTQVMVNAGLADLAGCGCMKAGASAGRSDTFGEIWRRLRAFAAKTGLDD
jgi:hypothetical protein